MGNLETMFALLDADVEYGVKYKSASTPLTLIKTKDGYTLHGFYDRSDSSINDLVQNFVFDKASGEVSHFNKDEDYCSIHFDKKQVEDIIKDSKCFPC